MQNIDYSVVHVPQNTRATAMGLGSVNGFSDITRAAARTKQRKLQECVKVWSAFKCGELNSHLMENAFNPQHEYAVKELRKIAPTLFPESMTRSDFANLTTFAMDRMMLANYAAYPSIYRSIAKVNDNVKDFRLVERWKMDGGELEYAPVGELEGFDRRGFTSGVYTYKVGKYEAGAQISWEAIINDDMSMFDYVPKMLGIGAQRTNDLFFTRLVADANGPHASFYTSGNGNIIVTPAVLGGITNPVLNYDNMSAAIAQFRNLRTSEGRGIDGGATTVYVMVGDGFLFETLTKIINTEYIATTVAGGSKATSAVMYDTQLSIKNWIGSRIIPVFNPELANVVTDAAKLAKSWWVFGSNNSIRPAVEMGHLQGYAEPAMFRKRPDTIRVGGSEDEAMGSYEYMGTEMKGLVIVGGTRMDPLMAMASNGSLS